MLISHNFVLRSQAEEASCYPSSTYYPSFFTLPVTSCKHQRTTGVLRCQSGSDHSKTSRRCETFDQWSQILRKNFLVKFGLDLLYVYFWREIQIVKSGLRRDEGKKIVFCLLSSSRASLKKSTPFYVTPRAFYQCRVIAVRHPSALRSTAPEFRLVTSVGRGRMRCGRNISRLLLPFDVLVKRLTG